ncbi:MAG TPA: hypothetical protein VKU41_04950, partial [Polyangiaceae bacterium]|nr:hypothetical protein [Polyangiaceae bacterium]
VIDPSSSSIYVVTHTFESGKCVYRLRRLNIATGADLANSPSGAFTATAFDASVENQRAGLALSKGQVYIGFGSYHDDGPWHGFLFAYDATALTQTAVFNATPNGVQGGIWQGGNAPVVDPNDGSLYVATGNGTFDEADFGESVLHLSQSGSSFQVLDFFSPFNENSLSGGDWDLASASPVMANLPQGKMIMQGMKGTGTVYALHANKLGGIAATDAAQQQNIVQEFQAVHTGDTAPADSYNLFNGVLYWSNPAGSNDGFLFALGQGDNVRRYAWNGSSFDTTNVVVSPLSGLGMMSLSSNGSASGSGIIWVISNSPRVLSAIDAEHSGLPVLWSTQTRQIDNQALGAGSTYNPPTVFNGHVYAGNGSAGAGSVTAYALIQLEAVAWCKTCPHPFPWWIPRFHVPRYPLVEGPVFHIGPWWGIGADGGVFYRVQQNGAWPAATELTAPGFALAGGDFHVAAKTTTETDAFLIANDRKLYASTQTNFGPWQAPTALTPANFVAGAPLDTISAGGQLGVVTVDTNGALEVVWWNPVLGWESPAVVTAAGYAPAGAAVAVGTRASGEIDAFSIGSDGALKYMAYTSGIWSGPYVLSATNFAPAGGAVATATDVHGYLNAFTVANDGALYTKWDCTALWCGPTSLTATAFAPPGGHVSAINFNNASMNAFLVDNTGSVNTLVNAGLGWAGPSVVAANLAQPGAPTQPVAESTTQLDVFALATGVASGMVESINTGSGWSAPVTLQ